VGHGSGEGGGLLSTKVSSELTKVSSELTKVSSELTKVSSKLAKVSSELTRISSELSKVISELTQVSRQTIYALGIPPALRWAKYWVDNVILLMIRCWIM
jgi:chromosome segregation ATPase